MFYDDGVMASVRRWQITIQEMKLSSFTELSLISAIAYPLLSSEIMALQLAFRGFQLCHIFYHQKLICQGNPG